MATEGRGRRPAAAPGRDGRRRRRTRDAAARQTAASAVGSAAASSPASAPSSPRSAPEPSSHEVAVARRRSGLTARAIALGVVLLLLTISYASSLRVYFDQQRQIAETSAEIRERQQHIEDLQSQIERWNDPNYVKAQARERLGWVVPGETGYRVVGPDGKPVAPGTEVIAETGAVEQDTWWQKLDGSLRAADGPAPATDPSTIPPTTPTGAPKTVGPSESSSTKGR